RSDPFLVVHAVLNPSTRIQYVLVEESLTGAVTLVDRNRYDPSNPIADGNGVPVSGAVVTLTDPNGLVMTGREEQLNGRGTGVYDINLDTYKTDIQVGGRYAISVAARGAIVTGTALVPNVAVPPPGAP